MINIPLVGSDAKAWTEVINPDLTINVPIIDKIKPSNESKTLQLINISFFSKANKLCNKAVAIIHGIKDTFSTGSQNQ